MSKVTLKNVVKTYGDVKVIHDLNLDIYDNEFIVLVGPSGCGKSTTLRMIAGLESISGGNVCIGERVVNDIPPKARNIAMVFQDYALYPHMTVYQNMSFSLKMKKMPVDEIEKSVTKAADILGITNLLNRKPHALSGGQRQRVAMGRAIVRNPEVFLFDEPLSNLDAKLRTQMRMELKKLHMKLKTTTVYVTHDQVEAMTLADRIVIMKDGFIQQVGTPIEVYEQPANIFVARFIGNPSMNIINGKIEKLGDGFVFKTGNLALKLPKSFVASVKDGMKVKVGLRPESITLSEDGTDFNGQLFDGEIVVSEIAGSTSLLDINLGGIELVVEVEGRKVFKGGEAMKFHLNSDHILLFDPESGIRL